MAETAALEFPKSNLGLQRGSILQASQDVPQLGIAKGMKFPIGFDGKYIRCTTLTWDIKQIEGEILRGIWTITGEVVDLTNPAIAKSFAEKIERRPASPV